MTETVRCRFVERGDDNRDLIILTYATPEGDRIFRQELAAQVVDSKPVTAARDVDPDDLEPVTDPSTRERYAAEAGRVANEYDPSDEI
jgi:hypothetical protein